MNDPLNDYLNKVKDQQKIRINSCNTALVTNFPEDMEGNTLVKIIYLENTNISWYKLLKLLYYFPNIEHLFILTENVTGSIQTFLDIINNFIFKTLVIKGNLNNELLEKWDCYAAEQSEHIYISNTNVNGFRKLKILKLNS